MHFMLLAMNARFPEKQEFLVKVIKEIQSTLLILAGLKSIPMIKMVKNPSFDISSRENILVSYHYSIINLVQ